MAVNSSSSPFVSFHPCDDSASSFRVSAAFNAARFLFLPLSLLVLHIGFQRRRRSFATTSHSDIFTYHSVATELIYTLGEAFYFCGEYTTFKKFIQLGYYLCSILVPGQISFHILTCVERYLAVVHPVLYLRLRQSGGVRIRNASIGCVWLYCLGWIGITNLYSPQYPYTPCLSFLAISLVVVSFCSLSVLCVLIRPGPGEMAGKREQVGQTRQRAFNTITAVTGVLWMMLLGFLVCVALERSRILSYSDGCVLLISGNFITLPSSLVLPLLFLHRAGKLGCCHGNDKKNSVTLQTVN